MNLTPERQATALQILALFTTALSARATITAEVEALPSDAASTQLQQNQRRLPTFDEQTLLPLIWEHLPFVGALAQSAREELEGRIRPAIAPFVTEQESLNPRFLFHFEQVRAAHDLERLLENLPTLEQAHFWATSAASLIENAVPLESRAA